MKQVQDGDTRNFELGAKKQSAPVKKSVPWRPCPNHPDYFTDGVSVIHKDNVPLPPPAI